MSCYCDYIALFPGIFADNVCLFCLFSQMLMSVWWRMVGVERCATTQREVSSAAAFYQAMRSQRTVPTVLVCKMAELSENGCVSN